MSLNLQRLAHVAFIADRFPHSNQLVQAVAGVNNNTIVVVNSVGPVILETILEQPNVQAIVWAGIAGQESGNGLVDILYGSTVPSGKLPYTIAKQTSDYGTSVQPGNDSYPEGLYIDYRHFDNAGIAPRYEFGYGLCKTNKALVSRSVYTNFHPSIYNVCLLYSKRHLHRQISRQPDPRTRRYLGSVRHRRHCHRRDHKQRHRRRGRSRAALYRLSFFGARYANQAAERVPEDFTGAGSQRDGDVRRTQEGSKLLGCTDADVDHPDGPLQCLGRV